MLSVPLTYLSSVSQISRFSHKVYHVLPKNFEQIVFIHVSDENATNFDQILCWKRKEIAKNTPHLNNLEEKEMKFFSVIFPSKNIFRWHLNYKLFKVSDEKPFCFSAWKDNCRQTMRMRKSALKKEFFVPGSATGDRCCRLQNHYRCK